ncbi:hypothetical protein CHS0354_017169 [Potamilus streckersoni]|uniref:Aminotransferase class I/classII large domain-containing protein n=1 Tax=Potamilus streckersoni TaxID=2493646 RepID=A0AAE0T2Q2_9BIVA|nr:hypothetical protein CHS0354_017169 [Potamilus streckersoni]
MAAINYSAFFSKTAKARKESPLRQLWEDAGEDIGSYINLAGGMPHEDTFPIKTMCLKLTDGTVLEMDKETTSEALQYGRTPGHFELLRWLTKLLKIVHNPPTLQDKSHPGQLDMLMTNGAQDGMYKILETLVDEGDIVFVESPTYPGFLAAALPHGCQLVPIETDENGLIPEEFSRALKDHSTNSGKKMKFLYCVPNGGNPTGICYTEDRKRLIYGLAREYDLLILEDDAYFFLESKPYTKSFLSLDTDGRVIRLDTFSKTISAGIRTGLLSGPKPIVEKAILAMQTSSQNCSGVSQAILLAVLQHMGHDGFFAHCEKVAEYYRRKRDLCVNFAEKHLKGLAEWNVPSGGMFLWIRVKVTNDSCSIVTEKLRNRKVLMVPGISFKINSTIPSAHIRVAYSYASEEQMDKAFRALAEELRTLATKVGTPQD